MKDNCNLCICQKCNKHNCNMCIECFVSDNEPKIKCPHGFFEIKDSE